MELYELKARQLVKMLAGREISSQEITQSYLQRIAGIDEKVKSYITVTPKQAQLTAQRVDESLKTSFPGMGVPIAIKDNMCTNGIKTTCGSKILENFVPPYDATVVTKIMDLPLLGKTNMDEFAMGSSTENSAFFPTKNPRDPNRVPGGSSGGSAAAVAANLAPWALGSDTGGSIRQPAAFCGVVGLKPTYGLVSRYGLVAFASSLDQIGCLTRDVGDCALLLEIISGHDPLDSTSAPDGQRGYLANLTAGVQGIKIGIPQEFFGQGVAPQIKSAVLDMVKALEAEGAQVVEVSLPHFDYALAVYYIIAPAEASSNLARYDGVRYGYRKSAHDMSTMFAQTRGEGFGSEVKRRIMLGTYALSTGYYDAYYLKALQVRTLICRDYDRVFGDCDVIMAPTTPTAAFKLGEKTADPMEMYMSDICTITANLAGIPAMSIPCGLMNGLPIGLQLQGPAFSEGKLLQIAKVVEDLASLGGGYHGI